MILDDFDGRLHERIEIRLSKCFDSVGCFHLARRIKTPEVVPNDGVLTKKLIKIHLFHDSHTLAEMSNRNTLYNDLHKGNFPSRFASASLTTKSWYYQTEKGFI